MTDITIPPEALEAGKDAAFSWLRSYMEDDVRVREMTDDELTEVVSAACLAMLKNWPGMGPIRMDQPIGEWCDKLPAIILPLTENTNAKV